MESRHSFIGTLRHAPRMGCKAISRWLPRSGHHRLTPPNWHFDPSGVALYGAEVLAMGFFQYLLDLGFALSTTPSESGRIFTDFRWYGPLEADSTTG